MHEIVILYDAFLRIRINSAASSCEETTSFDPRAFMNNINAKISFYMYNQIRFLVIKIKMFCCENK